MAVSLLDRVLELGRANLWSKAAKKALVAHVEQCPRNDYRNWQEGCTFPNCFIYEGRDEDGDRVYVDESELEPHCLMAKRLGAANHQARIAQSTCRGKIAKRATEMAQQEAAKR